MLVKFNVAPAGVSNIGNVRRLNFLRCIEAIATAPAGSTPSVAPFTAYSNNSIDTNLNCITEVISNTEAGGWDDNSGDTYSYKFNLSATNPLTFDSNMAWSITKPSGKGTHPWYYFGVFAGNNTSLGNSSGQNWNGNGFDFGMGAVSDPNNLLNAMTNSQVYIGYNSLASHTHASGDPMNDQRNGASSNTNKYSVNVNPLYIGDTDTEIIAAITGKYIIIATKTAITYFGFRDQSQWETTMTANPPFVGFAYTNRLGSGWCTTAPINTYHWSMATMNTGRLNISTLQPEAQPYTFTRVSYASGNDRTIPCAISGMHVPNYFNNSSSSSTTGLSLNWSAAAMGNGTNMPQTTITTVQYGGNSTSASAFGGFEPLFPIYSNHAGSSSNYSTEFNEGNFLDTPLQDVATGAYYPSATPIIFKARTQGAYPGSGTAPGILKGMYGPKSFLESTIVTETEYTYNGDTYIPVWTGADIDQVYSDLFFIKKA